MRRRPLILLLAGLTMLLIGGNNTKHTGKNYYVSMTGRDSNPGTISLPFRSIEKGCSVLQPGDTLHIMKGRYFEKIQLKKSGAKDGYITICNYNHDTVILDGSRSNNSSSIIQISNKSYIRIKGLELCNSFSGDTPAGILVEGSGTGIEICNNRIYNILSDDNAHAIGVYGTNGHRSIQKLLIDSNEIFNCRLGSSETIAINGNVEHFKITNNKIHDNNNIGIDCIGFEGTAKQNDQARSGIIACNVVFNISSKSNPAYNGDACAGGIYVDGGKDIIIEKNIVHHCDIGIEVASEHRDKAARNIITRNNLVYNCSLYGISLGGADKTNGYADTCTFTNNTLYNNFTGINIQKARNNHIENNIVSGGSVLLEGLIGTNNFSYNLWYMPGKQQQRLQPFLNPLFVSPMDGDFRLQAGSPAINSGNPHYIADTGETDLYGQPRIMGGRIDCGAIEYQQEE